jgi:DNA adenine methylase
VSGLPPPQMACMSRSLVDGEERFYSPDLRAPFPWYGGKSLAAPMLWRAFGNVPNYVEPFAGSLAVLLSRPHAAKVETVNDKDGLVANFWRAVQADPDAVADHADWPVNEADLHARHGWLVRQLPLVEQLIADPDWYDAKIAGWWVWGICTWIGGGWCSKDERLWRATPKLSIPGHGIHSPTRQRRELAAAAAGVQVPEIGSPGRGIHAPTWRPDLSSAGRGIHAASARAARELGAPAATTGKKPHTHRGKGVHRQHAPVDLFRQLQARLRGVRVCCGDWTRVTGRSTLGIDTRHGMTPTAILLDPPYSHELRDKRLYREDAPDLAAQVRAWAIEHGDNPDLRIALCGLKGEHDMPDSWTCVSWASTSSAASRSQERIWLSPHCLLTQRQQSLFADDHAMTAEEFMSSDGGDR